MNRFFMKTMGCKSNQLEGCLIEEHLIKHGFEKSKKLEDSDIFILNSCTVTHKSDNEAFHILLKVKQKNPNIKTVLTGCIAQIEKEKLLENPNIDVVLGNDEKLELSKYLNSSSSVGDIMKLNSFHDVILQDTKKTRASLKIQDGCDNRCSYCIIPFARGKNRSADIDFILKQIKVYENVGFKEIMLTGIHIGQWGLDKSSPQKQNLLYLLKNIEEKTNIERFRLGSLNPLEIDDEMLDFLTHSKKFCPHFHLSIQSMCDKTLKSMNRHYTVQQSLNLIEKISQKFELPFIGSDMIAGFAGESETDFQITIENLEKSKLTKIHTFPYSIRKNTTAEKFKDQLDAKTKNIRATIIKEISTRKYNEFLQKSMGSIQEILIEKNLDKKTGFLKGVSRNYINILADPSPNIENFDKIKNTLQKVKIQSINSTTENTNSVIAISLNQNV